MPRSDEWMEEYGHHLDGLAPDVRALVLDGSVEICPACLELSAYAWEDVTAEDGREPGKIHHVPTAGAWEWECGACGTHWTEADSPINHPAYTHSED